MPLSKITAFALAGIIAIGIAGVFAQDVTVSPDIEGMSPEQKVERRQEIMKENGGILRNIGTLAAADAAAAADTMIQNFTDLPALFAEGTIVGDSRALPLIWQEKDAFDAIFADAKEHAAAIKAAAEAGDTAAIGAEAQELGGYCGQCHNKYRAS
jgi:cytochrome c556